ncbi:hypothetical protein LOK74_15850 [Brevibacillus humidisoli]|uniref:hypothetical protein n=1 Tax=Brevibacillus humidisoli TaxID=2895522 RepID=UPI001E372F72|nr:hypothetical protein [Brevibacillus humidisoli]UFJ39523.1 hypothetical protein LOK74_15850 [Brevibacillus humidisoli]
MNQIIAFLAGLIGGYALTEAPLAGTFLSSLESLIDVVGLISMVVFSAGLIYSGVKGLIGKS